MTKPVKVGLVLVVVAAIVVAYRQLPVADTLQAALDWVDGLGVWGPVALAGVYVVAAVLLVPGSILTLGAGALFGVVEGSVTVWIAANLGAAAAFLVGRYAARGWVQDKFVEGNERFAAIDEAVGREGFKIVLLTRLSPVFPFNMLNYAYGLTAVPFGSYVLASLIGMLPGTVMYVYLGAVAGDVATAQAQPTSAGEWALRIVGLIVTIVVAVYVARIARAALKREATV